MDASTLHELFERARKTGKRTHYVYGEKPNIPACAVAIALYGLSFFCHAFQIAKYRTWFMSAVVIAALMEVMGYAIRMVTIFGEAYYSRGLFIAQFALVVLAPVFIAAGDYLLLGKLLTLVMPGGRHAKTLRVSARWITYLFVGGDIFSFALQGIGAGMMSGADGVDMTKKMETGKRIMLAGLAVQIISFLFFTVAAVRFDVKSRRLLASEGKKGRPRWRILLWCLYLSCFLILLRNAYRVVEFSEGWTGYLAVHEVFFYCLEAIPMLPPLVIFNIWYPARYLPKEPYDAARSSGSSGGGSVVEERAGIERIEKT